MHLNPAKRQREQGEGEIGINGNQFKSHPVEFSEII
jgi:hypothetical protein